MKILKKMIVARDNFYTSLLKENDILLMKGAYEKLNHVAIYVGDQTILHHVIGKLSCREIFDLQYQQITKKVYRYEP